MDLNILRIAESSICVTVADSSTPDFLDFAPDLFIDGSVPTDGYPGDVINEVVVSSSTNSDEVNMNTDAVAVGVPHAYNAYRIRADSSFMEVSESSDIDVDGSSDGGDDDLIDIFDDDADSHDISESDFEYVSESDFEYGRDNDEVENLDVDIEGDESMVGSDDLSQDYNVSNGSEASDLSFLEDESDSGCSHSTEVPDLDNVTFSEDYNVSNSYLSDLSGIGDDLSDADDEFNESNGDVSVASNYGSSNEDDYISDELSMLSDGNDFFPDVNELHGLRNNRSGSGFDDDSNAGFDNFRGGVEVQVFAGGCWVMIPIAR